MNRAVSAFVLVLAMFVGLHAQVGTRQRVMDANTAAEKELLAVPHLTPELVKTILQRRPFSSVKDLNAALQPLSAQQRSEAYRSMFVAINLNSAARDEILLIPGVGERLAHEFEEYRPYKALAVFRKEIGKYVDAKEVARLEQYVFVPITSIRRPMPISCRFPVWGSGCCTNSRNTGRTSRWSSFVVKLASTCRRRKSHGWSAT